MSIFSKAASTLLASVILLPMASMAAPATVVRPLPPVAPGMSQQIKVIPRDILINARALPATAPTGLLPDLIEVAGRPSLSVPSGTDTCKAAILTYGGVCDYIGGGNPPDFPNGQFGFVNRVVLR